MTSVHADHEVMDHISDVSALLFGDGAFELVAKMTPTSSDLAAQKKRERRQAQVGLASNIVGLAAGGAGTASAYGDYQSTRAKRSGKLTAVKEPGKFAAKAKKFTGKHAVGVAGAALGLQVANVAGDAIANRVLARSAKQPQDHKKKKVSKRKDGTPVTVAVPQLSKGKLVAAGVQTAKPAAKAGAKQVQEVREKLAKSTQMDIVWEGEFAKFDIDKRQVFGWASIVELNGEPVVDLQGDYITAEEIEKAAYDYVVKSRKGGDMHRREQHEDGERPFHASDMIESFMVTPEKVEQMGLPAGSLPTGWWVGYQVHDEETWNLVKSGKRSGFSIHGRGKRVEQQD